MFRLVLAALAGAQLLVCQSALDRAYAAVREKRYDEAVELFRAGLRAAPDHATARKDLAYTLLKTGETEQARDEFALAMRADPSDTHVAMEYAFLAYETRQPVEARRIFDRLRRTGNATAEQAFQNIDRPLAEGISRWQAALRELPDNFSGHEELAKLAALREDHALAARHFLRAWELKPAYRNLLLDLGHAYKALGRHEDAHAALLAASRGAEPRTAEQARELLPDRYPYVYEFQRALALDPANTAARRELAYLHLQMDAKAEAEEQFARIAEAQPDDLLSAAQLGFLKLARKDISGAMPYLNRVLDGDDEALAQRVRVALKLPPALKKRPDTQPAASTAEARTMAFRSYEKGYMNDALKYLTLAHETDPLDFEIMLKLGWANNLLRKDDDAVRWFDLARRAPDEKIAVEAHRAYRNLAQGREKIATTFWILPMFSSRWRDAFTYSQLKAEIRLARLPKLRPYFSARLLADARGIEHSRVSNGAPQYLSESAGIFGVGFSTVPVHGVSVWAEAGTSISYRNRAGAARAAPDYRGGIIAVKFRGTALGGESPGWFTESMNDGVFISRFDNDFLLVSQNKFGKTVHPNLQLFAAANLTADVKRQYWANFAETGAGVRLRWPGLPPNVNFTVQALRGVHTINRFNPRRPNFFDLRAGFWYAITR